jgi:hypothetical protein
LSRSRAKGEKGEQKALHHRFATLSKSGGNGKDRCDLPWHHRDSRQRRGVRVASLGATPLSSAGRRSMDSAHSSRARERRRRCLTAPASLPHALHDAAAPVERHDCPVADCTIHSPRLLPACQPLGVLIASTHGTA